MSFSNYQCFILIVPKSEVQETKTNRSSAVFLHCDCTVSQSCPRSWRVCSTKAKLSTTLNVFLCVCFATLVRTDNSTDTSLLWDSPHPLVCLPHPTHCISQTALMRMCAKGFAISPNPQTIIIARQRCSELLLTELCLIFCQSGGQTFWSNWFVRLCWMSWENFYHYSCILLILSSHVLQWCRAAWRVTYFLKLLLNRMCNFLNYTLMEKKIINE